MSSLIEVDDFSLIDFHQGKQIFLKLKILSESIFACCLRKKLDVRLQSQLAGSSYYIFLEDPHVANGERIEFERRRSQKSLLFEGHQNEKQ